MKFSEFKCTDVMAHMPCIIITKSQKSVMYYFRISDGCAGDEARINFFLRLWAPYPLILRLRGVRQETCLFKIILKIHSFEYNVSTDFAI